MKKYQVAILIALVWQTCSATIAGLDFVVSVTLDEASYFSGVNWCGDNCEYIATAGIYYSPGTQLGLLQIYELTNNKLSLVDSVTLDEASYFSGVNWCGDNCEYIGVAGADSSSGSQLGLLQVYAFTNNKLSFVDSVTLTGNTGFNGVSWCGDNCEYVAVAGSNASTGPGLLQIYEFANNKLSFVDSVTVAGRSYFSGVNWCGDCEYVAVAGYHYSSDSGLLQVYTFTNNKLSFVDSVTLASGNTGFSGVDWCGDNCEYIAAAGVDASSGTASGLLQIYEFTNNKLSFVDSVTLDIDSEFSGVDWCGGSCEYIATTGIYYSPDLGLGLLQVYQFANNKLSLKESTTLDVGSYFYGANWCGSNCEYVASAGGDNSSGSGLLQVYKTFQDTAISAPTVHAQKRYNRFPTQVDIINTLWWQAVTDAVSYNVYADSELSQLLAHVTHAPYIYSQHQIQPGSQKTYYVTSVDAAGDESEAAEITI